ncbi:hypothetical protein BH20ACI4_BH20ACI4_22560 [soil metagenome]
MEFQTAEMIFEICKRIEEKDYYFHNSETKICGIQFLKNSGKSGFSEPLSMTDIGLFKFLAKRFTDVFSHGLSLFVFCDNLFLAI